ncbi:electron transfer flavoprotein subunit beta/FixA family protein [Mycoplasmatota bacterium WC44]
MNIIVLVKQVPDTTEMNIDKETGTLIRDGVETIINPDDLAGVEEALKLKEQISANVTVITMGPPSADKMLRELYARGVDNVYLITDKKFAGADTLATSKTLVSLIRKLPFDLIIAGRQAIDGDTAQVGPQVAEFLNIPQVTYVEEINEVTTTSITVKKAYEDYSELIKVELPCLITTLSEINTPRYMDCNNIVEAFEKEIEIVKFDDLLLNIEEVGLKGSPTRVKKTFVREISKKVERQELEPKEAVETIVKALSPYLG